MVAPREEPRLRPWEAPDETSRAGEDLAGDPFRPLVGEVRVEPGDVLRGRSVSSNSAASCATVENWSRRTARSNIALARALPRQLRLRGLDSPPQISRSASMKIRKLAHVAALVLGTMGKARKSALTVRR